MSKFTWGRVVDKFELPFDGVTMEIVKYHPWEYNNCTSTGRVDEGKILYHCPQLNESAYSIQYLVIAWIAYKNLGLNEGALVRGIAKALEIKEVNK